MHHNLCTPTLLDLM